MKKVSYDDKEAIQNDDSIPNKNKVTAEDMNEIKEAINQNANDSEELRQENIEIKAENRRLKNDINNIALLGQVEGESVDLEDSSEARFNKFEIGGNHKQETREGYNLLNLSTLKGKIETKNGVTYTVNDDGCSSKYTNIK